MGIASLIISILAILLTGIALIPLLNLLNCIAVPLALLSGTFGLIDVIRHKRPGQGRAAGVIGLILSILVFLIAVVRLVLSLAFGIWTGLPGIL